MKRKAICLTIVLCMMLTLLPTTVFAAESYGIYVGSTEVTSANYQNITGPGISGKVYYDPEQHELVLENATITSYTDTAPDAGYGDLAGLYSLWDTLTIRLIGKNTIQPDLAGNTAEYCSAVGSLGSLFIAGYEQSSLTAKASGANFNLGILCAEQLEIGDTEVHVESGPSANGSSYGIYTKLLRAGGITQLLISSGNCPNGESIGLYVSESINSEKPINVISGDAQFSCGICSENDVYLDCPLSVKSGAATEYDSIGIYGSNRVVIGVNSYIISSGNSITNSIVSGFSAKGSSVAVSGKGISYDARALSATSGEAPNGISAVFFAEGGITLRTGVPSNVTLKSGNALSSYCLYSGNSIEIAGTMLNCTAGTASQVDSIAMFAEGHIWITDVIGEIHGGYAPEGYSYGLHSNDSIIFTTQTFNKTAVTGLDAAAGCEVGIRKMCYWSGNPDSTDPLWIMHHQETDPIENSTQYKYLYIITENYLMPTPFKDVPKDVYYIEPVLWAVENEITTGTAPITFSPKDTCTRAQTVTFLWRAAGCPEPVSTDMPFTDVREGSYYYKAVQWAVENGITNGITPTTFEPSSTVTRGQVVTFLWRSKGEPEVTAEDNIFTDVFEGQFYYNSVLWAVENEITNGMTATTFEPKSGCTRAQIVTFLWRADDIEIPEDPAPDEPLPEESVPEESVPEESIPEESVPEESVPEESVPEESVPEESVPEESVPEESVPEESVPEESVPEESAPDDSENE